jgi:hypothetical protein
MPLGHRPLDLSTRLHPCSQVSVPASPLCAYQRTDHGGACLISASPRFPLGPDSLNWPCTGPQIDQAAATMPLNSSMPALLDRRVTAVVTADTELSPLCARGVPAGERPNQIILICTASRASGPALIPCLSSIALVRARAAPSPAVRLWCVIFLHARPNDLQPRLAAAGDRPPIPSQRGRVWHATSRPRARPKCANRVEGGDGHVTNACTLSRWSSAVSAPCPCPCPHKMPLPAEDKAVGLCAALHATDAIVRLVQCSIWFFSHLCVLSGHHVLWFVGGNPSCSGAEWCGDPRVRWPSVVMLDTRARCRDPLDCIILHYFFVDRSLAFLA